MGQLNVGYCQGTKFHLSTQNYEWNLERTGNSSQSTLLWKELLEEVNITYYSLMSFIVYAFKRQVHVFAGRVKIVSHSGPAGQVQYLNFCPLIEHVIIGSQCCDNGSSFNAKFC